MTIDGVPAHPRPGPAPATSRRRVLTVVVTGWAVLVVVLAVFAVHRGGSTVRPQTSVAQALPTVDRAIADVVAAAWSAGAVAEISGYDEVGHGCSITAVRDGARYERAARLVVPAGQERALLDRVAAQLPRDYGARVWKSGGDQFTADAGAFVAVRGGRVGPGEVRLTADTGCRPLTGPVVEPSVVEPSVAEPSVAEPSVAAGRAPVESVLAALKVSDPRWQVHRVGCAHGGAVWTVHADGTAGSAPTSLADALRTVSPDAMVARPDLYAYRSGPVGVVARTQDGGGVTVTATTVCGAQ